MGHMKYIVLLLVLSLLFGACQANQAPESGETPGAYPNPGGGENPVMPNPAYPAPGDHPMTQETPFPPSNEEPPASSSDYSPKPGDAKLSTGNAFPDLGQSGILLLESFPVQVKLLLYGDLPTPCNELRVKVEPPDAEKRIQVEVYSVVDPDILCIQVISPFDAQVSLGSFASGKYTVYVNGEYLGEFTI